MKYPSIPGREPLRLLLLGSVCSLFAATAVTHAQTGVYTLTGSTASQSNQTYAATVADQSGVYVLSSGELTLTSPTITKTGDASDTTNSSKYGVNAGVLTNSAGEVTITGGTVTTNASGANGLFATGTGSSVTMSNGTITTTGNASHGVDVTYGGAVTLNNVNISTQATSASAALSTDYGGGTVAATGGTMTTAGSMSPDIYSTGTITVTGATMTATGGPGAVIDGSNTVSLTNCSLTGKLYGAKLHRTASGTGTATFTVNGGSLSATAGDLFFMVAESGSLTANITLRGGVTVSTSTGYLVDATASSTANFVADGETLTGNFITDKTSTVAATLQNGTTLTGYFNSGSVGTESLTVDATSTWNVNGASVLSSLTNNGTLAFTTDGLTVDVAGAYTQASTSKVVVVLNGTTAGTNYDQVAVTGKATLAGALEVNAANGFTPTVGETFNILTYGSESGSFATLTSDSGLTYTVNYGSTEATITITAVSSATAAPTITTQPASADAAVGTSVAFSVVASGSGTLGYQWYKDGTAISGATSASYTISAATSTDAGSYYVVVSNSAGSTTSSAATLTVTTTTASVPVVTIEVRGDGEIVEGNEKGKILISRTGDTTNALTVAYKMKGSAVNGTDYVGTDGLALPGTVIIPAGSASVKIKIAATSGTKSSSVEKVKMVLQTSSTGEYTLGTGVIAKLVLIDSK